MSYYPPAINITGLKAWVNFDNRGTFTVNGSFNVSSVTDNGVGDFTVNFVNPAPNINYLVLQGPPRYDDATSANLGEVNVDQMRDSTFKTTSSFRCATKATAVASTKEDCDENYLGFVW